MEWVTTAHPLDVHASRVTATLEDRRDGTAPRAEPTALRGRQLWLVLIAVMLAGLLAALDQTIVATALPTIVGDLGGASHLSWVVTAYLLGSTSSTPLWGKLGDMYGRKRFFLAAIVIFLVGSALSGLSTSMGELIAFRAIQGIGGGGLIIGAQTIIGDVVAPADRGRYQGIFGAVFGVASVLGPLLGGVLVDHASWRWVFYINLPIGLIALLATSAFLPARQQRVSHVIDYLGAILIALAATSLVMMTSLGGTTYAWGSAPIVILGVAGVLLLVAFVAVERRAAEPVLPPRLFRNRVFSISSTMAFVVGFAMFGSITFLPLYLQVVDGVSPTMSGVRLLPMVGGLLLTSIGSGQVISRTGRYKVFPILGTALMTLGLYLLSRLGPHTSELTSSLYMLVFGLGLGCVMQVLVIAVQNAVGYEDLGSATSGVTFARSMGGSFGTALFGSVFSHSLTGNLHRYLGGVRFPSGVSSSSVNPHLLSRLPPAIHTGFIDAYAASLHTVFRSAIPLGIFAFVLSWLLPEVKLRKTVAATDTGETLGMPTDRSSLQELERAVGVLDQRENRVALYQRINAKAGQNGLRPAATCLLSRICEQPGVSITRLGEELGVSATDLAPSIDQLTGRGLVSMEAGVQRETSPLTLTGQGQSALGRLRAARSQELTALLDGWSPDEHPELTARLQTLAREYIDEDTRKLNDDELLAAAA